MKRTLLGLLASAMFVAVLSGEARSAAAAPKEVVVAATRIHLSDLVPDVDASIASLDLGPAPVAGGTRLVTRDEIKAAIDARQAAQPAALPDVIRVVRKTKRFTRNEMDALVRGAVAAKALRSGVSLATVRIDHPVDVAEGWTHVDLEMPRTPKKTGPFETTAVVTFRDDDAEIIARVAVPVAFDVSADGATYDVSRGTGVTLTVRRSLVEVHVPAVAMTDADVGDPLPVQIRLSGRTVRARLVAKDEALAVEGAR